MIAGENSPTALTAADFDIDDYPNLVTGYSALDCGILTFRKANPEAFAPLREESFALIKEGRFPDPFLEKAENYAVPIKPDFLVKGNFDHDGNPDVIAAARAESKMYLLSGMGKDDGFNAAREIELSGRITAMTGGGTDAPDIGADLLIGVEGEDGAALLVFENSENGVFDSPLSYRLSATATSSEVGQLDNDFFIDAAVLTADGVFILHGRKQKSLKRAVSGLKKINLPFVPQAITLGNFI